MPLLFIAPNNHEREKEASAWERHGVLPKRVESMQEAIEKLEKYDYLFVAINADNIEYLPKLRTMRDVTDTPIFIIATEYSVEKEIEAIDNGADSFIQWRHVPEDNIKSVLTILQRYTERSRQHDRAIRILSQGDIILVITYRYVLVGDMEIKLTKKEFDILHYLMINRGRVLSYDQIISNVWGDDYIGEPPDILWSHINKLRNKLSKASKNRKYIENVRDIGYRFIANTEI